MTFTSSELKYCVQKTTIQRDVGLRIYYFAYMNSPPRFESPLYLIQRDVGLRIYYFAYMNSPPRFESPLYFVVAIAATN